MMSPAQKLSQVLSYPNSDPGRAISLAGRMTCPSAGRTSTPCSAVSTYCRALIGYKLLAGHQGSRVKSFAVSGNGRVAVTVLFDSSISVWDLVKSQVSARNVAVLITCMHRSPPADIARTTTRCLKRGPNCQGAFALVQS